jgi:hypothetical protein
MRENGIVVWTWNAPSSRGRRIELSASETVIAAITIARDKIEGKKKTSVDNFTVLGENDTSEQVETSCQRIYWIIWALAMILRDSETAAVGA